MKCVAIASTFPVEELRTQTQADLVVSGFEVIHLSALQRLFQDRPEAAQEKV